MALFTRWLAGSRNTPRHSSRKATRRRPKSTSRLRCEPLEGRELMASVVLEGAVGFSTGGSGSHLNAVKYTRIVHDTAGNAYLSGSLTASDDLIGASIDLDPNNGAPDDPAIVHYIGSIGVIAKYDAAGNFQWVRKLEGENGARVYATLSDLAIGSLGNLYFTGTYNSSAVNNVMDGVVLANVGTSAGDRYIGKMDTAGNVEWLFGFSEAGGHDSVPSWPSLAVNEGYNNDSGIAYVVGTGGFSDIGGNPATFVVAVTNLTTTPEVDWSTRLTSKVGGNVYGQTGARDVEVDASGSVYVTGYFIGTADFNPSASSTLNISSGSDGSQHRQAGYVWKLTSSGTLGWAKALLPGKNSSTSPWGISLDSSGNVVVAGNFSGTVDFDPSTAKYNLTSSGGANVFLVKLSSTGAFKYATRYGSGPESVWAMTRDAAGSIYLAGTVLVKFVDNSTNFSLDWSQAISRPELSGVSISPNGKFHAVGGYSGGLNADNDPDNELDTGDPNKEDLFWLTYGQLP